MRKLLSLIGVVALGAGAWLFFQNFELDGLSGLKVVPRSKSSSTLDPTRGDRESIRIATFNIKTFGPSKASKPHIMEKLAKIIGNFDVVAIQEIRSKRQDIVAELVKYCNADGRKYDYVVGPQVGRKNYSEQFAFVFDTERIEVDHRQLYTVEDPRDEVHREPLVGWFRAKGPPAEEAFTFTLVNLHTDPDHVKEELTAMRYLVDDVRNDGREEDDVILLGDFNADAKQIARLIPRTGLIAVVTDLPTNTRGTAQYDNLLFDEAATREFNGRGGVFDFLREFNLQMEDALQISDHLPVWAEFSTREGGRPGRVAVQPVDPPR